MHEGMNRKIRFANRYPDNVISLIAVKFLLHENTGISNIDRRLDRLPRRLEHTGTGNTQGVRSWTRKPALRPGPQARE